MIKVEENVDKDPKRGFATLNEFAIVAANGCGLQKRGSGEQLDPRLRPLAAVPGDMANEGSGVTGGFLLPPAWSTEIFSTAIGEDSFLDRCDESPIAGNSIGYPTDESQPWDATAGVRASWVGEGKQASLSRPTFSAANFRMKKLIALVPVSDELMEDGGPALGKHIPEKASLNIRWAINEAILNGSGIGAPLGIFNTSAAVTVPKDAGQAAATISVNNLSNMYARLPPGSQKNAVWLVNNDVTPAMQNLTLGNYPMMRPLGGGRAPLQDSVEWLLMGRPVLITQHANTFGGQGDVMLMDFKAYRAITKAGGMQTATSMHLYFDADAMAFRFTFRVDGGPKYTKPITPARGPNLLSPFVQLAAR